MRDIKKYSAWDLLHVFVKAAQPFPKHQRKFWMSGFDDEAIRNQQMFWTKLSYVHNNPLKAGIVSRPEDYRYSSARNYILGDHSVLEVDTSLAGHMLP